MDLASKKWKDSLLNSTQSKSYKPRGNHDYLYCNHCEKRVDFPMTIGGQSRCIDCGYALTWKRDK